MLKPIDEPIQISGGCLNCPHCAGDISLATIIGGDMDQIHLVFHCNDCHKLMSLEMQSCSSGHTHVAWMEGKPEEGLDIAKQIQREKNDPETGENLN